VRPTDTTYRPDIDGLRALAVLAVVAFHAFPGRVPGGFVGVDVFFVISGYLITGIIAGEASRGTFSYLRFYARRARRIFPALIVVVIATLLLGWLMLLPDEFERLGVDAIGGTLFSANFVFWHEAGYFDVASVTKPLLHLWSLGVEEQFYLVWPVTLVAIWRWRRHRLAIIGAIAIVSFVLNVAIVRTNPTAAFNAPWTRMWELMIGALLAVMSSRAIYENRETMSSRAGGEEREEMSSRAEGEGPAFLHSPGTRDLASLAGLVLIVTATMRFSSELPYPGWFALAPTLGTALIIAAGPQALVNRALLARPAAVFVGLISYPLYLWHWPLLVFLRIVLSESLAPLSPGVSRVVTLAVVGLSFIAAYLTYRHIEMPLRRRIDLTMVAGRLAFALGITACLALGITLNPTPLRSGDQGTAVAMAARKDWTTPISPDAVFYASGSGAPEILFVGDSHTEQYYPAAKHAAEAMAPVPTVAFSTKGGCPFLPLVNERSCGSVYRRSLALASEPSVKRVVIAGAWPLYVDEEFGRGNGGATLLRVNGRTATLPDVQRAFRALASDVAGLRAMGKDVVILTSHPNLPSADPLMLAAPLRVPFVTSHNASRFGPFSLAEFKQTAAWIDEQLASVARESGARLIAPGDYVCASDVCPAADESGRPLRMDSGHFRPFAAIRYFTYVPSLLAR